MSVPKMTEERTREIIKEELSPIYETLSRIMFILSGDKENGVEGLADKINRTIKVVERIDSKETIVKTETMYESYSYLQKIGAWRLLENLVTYERVFIVVGTLLGLVASYNLYEIGIALINLLRK